ncbi:MAG: hypothetical protein QM702_20595 [Rubrivivax sp.]
MESSKRTLKDLSFTGSEGQGTILDLIDRSSTHLGSSLIRKMVVHTPSSCEKLLRQQDAIRFWVQYPGYWPEAISNGTVVMLQKFFESADAYAAHPGGLSLFGGKWLQKLLNRNEFHFTQFSLSHLSDFLKGCTAFVETETKVPGCPPLIRETFAHMQQQLEHSLTNSIIHMDKDASFKEIATLSFRARREMKSNILHLMDDFAKLDAWKGLADATRQLKWQFPVISESSQTFLHARGLFHPLIAQPVAYDIDFTPGSTFMLLTGANMSGKTTLMRALGVATLLAKMGMGVPAASFGMTFLNSVLTNMHVEDDLLKGESFFLAEVKTIRQTIAHITESGPQLVLMDELFKGTNVHDAYECTKAIVEGMLRHPEHIMILSTHLHEVAHYFEGQNGVSFYRFTTHLGTDGNFVFDYRLEPGISDERIGYRILVKEGIIDLLRKRS